MDDDQYWDLVERARNSSGEVAVELVGLLGELSPAEVLAADDAFNRISARGYGWPLWGAAYLINGGCSDDGFDYFRGWLVGQGRAVFERALADPDSLADVVTADDADEAFDEDVLGAGWTAYEELTGEELPQGAPVTLPDLGEGWDFDDETEMRTRYPRLAAVFL